jgi:hypothetical protein
MNTDSSNKGFAYRGDWSLEEWKIHGINARIEPIIEQIELKIIIIQAFYNRGPNIFCLFNCERRKGTLYLSFVKYYNAIIYKKMKNAFKSASGSPFSGKHTTDRRTLASGTENKS